MLPSFFVSGAMKGGTTSVFRYLSEHPDVFACKVKDPEFFVTYRWPNAKDFMWSLRPNVPPPYDAMFPLYQQDDIASYEALYRGWTRERVGGEGTALYLACPWVPKTLRAIVPAAKIIAILRDPVERAISHWRFERQLDPNLVDDDFDVAVRKVERRVNGDSVWHWGLVPTGFYGEQLSRYFELFPREQIHVCFFDDLLRDPVSVMQGIFAFLGIDSSFRPALRERHNASLLPKPTISAETMKWLEAQFTSDLRVLEALLDRPLPNWRTLARGH
jgi:hypothetical protein